MVPLAMVDDLLAIAPCGISSIALNTFINVNIELKKLKFHTPDAKGRSKCHKIHIGKNTSLCPKLFIHGTEMETVERDEYLGDIISNTGSNKPNIEKRVSRGYGKVAEIMAIIKQLSLGKHYFRVAFLLRNSIFLSSVLANSEVWYNLTRKDINELEALDRTLLRRICNLPSSTPIPALYMETGAMRISTIIKARRVNYLHYLSRFLHSDMLGKFFRCQWNSSRKYDWGSMIGEV